MNEELPRLQEGVYYGAINLRTDILEKFLSEEGQPRYNPQVRNNHVVLYHTFIIDCIISIFTTNSVIVTFSVCRLLQYLKRTASM